MRVNNSTNQVQQYYLNQKRSKKKSLQANLADSIFASLLVSARIAATQYTSELDLDDNWMVGVTEKGKNSKGDKQLTEEQRKYLSQKYDVTDIPASQCRLLLGELANMGALSFEDYQLATMTTGPSFPVARVHNPSADYSCRNAVAHYKCVAQQELEDGNAVFQRSGKRVSLFQQYANVHNRIADLLQTLVRAN